MFSSLTYSDAYITHSPVWLQTAQFEIWVYYTSIGSFSPKPTALGRDEEWATYAYCKLTSFQFHTPRFYSLSNFSPSQLTQGQLPETCKQSLMCKIGGVLL